MNRRALRYLSAKEVCYTEKKSPNGCSFGRFPKSQPSLPSTEDVTEGQKVVLARKPSIRGLENKVEAYLTLREQNGHATLEVQALATTSFGALIKGNYHVVYADTWCMILRPSNPKG
ncbi:hypothetical protein V5799_029486 [Amblyomma americanum]|uniref:Uncharacterized protein n=1 Tax=Amblyomma americanum TaxID=6943 RepID=A0AAQ4ER43_AMBAM